MDEYEVQFIAEALKRNLLFEKLSSVQVAQAISLMGKVEVAVGERICTQGEEDAKLMYIVLSGAFDVVVKKDSKSEPQKVARVEAGYGAGRLTCGEVKCMAAEAISALLHRHQAARERVTDEDVARFQAVRPLL